MADYPDKYIEVELFQAEGGKIVPEIQVRGLDHEEQLTEAVEQAITTMVEMCMSNGWSGFRLDVGKMFPWEIPEL